MTITKLFARVFLYLLIAVSAAAQSGDAITTASLPLGTGSGIVIMAEIDNRVIGPITAEYIETILAKAQQRNAECLVIKLDTPGGLLESTKRIVGDLLNAEVPVVVWVAPSGSRAASAGMFITMAGHVAVMAPGTHIGAAHPVNLGGGEEDDKEKPKDDESADPFVRELQRYISRQLREKEKEETAKRLADEKQADKENTFRTIDGEGEPGEDAPAVPLEPDATIETADSATPTPAPADDDSPPEPRSTGSTMGDKVLNDTVAWAHNIADLRGRNGQWAELAVRASVSATDKQAVLLNVVDFTAETEGELLQKLQGRAVKLPANKQIRLNTQGAAIERMPMSFRHRLLDIIVHPEIALIFMMLGFFGLLYEVTHPGIGVPGIAGAIFFIIGLYAMNTLPVNFAGLLLLALAIALFVAEAKVASYGLLTMGGLVCMVLGMLMLIRDPAPFTGRVSLSMIIPLTLATAGITVGLVTLVLRSRRVQVATGSEGMVGDRGVAITDINPRGRIEVGSETWSAVSAQPIKKGEAIVVKSVSGLTCTVEKVE